MVISYCCHHFKSDGLEGERIEQGGWGRKTCKRTRICPGLYLSPGNYRGHCNRALACLMRVTWLLFLNTMATLDPPELALVSACSPRATSPPSGSLAGSSYLPRNCCHWNDSALRPEGSRHCLQTPAAEVAPSGVWGAHGAGVAGQTCGSGQEPLFFRAAIVF